MALKTEKIRGVSEKEIREQAEDKNARILWCKRYDYIYSAEIEYYEPEEIKTTEVKKQDEKKYSVYRYFGNQLMYIGAKRMEYTENLAKLFTKEAATKKAEAMNRNIGASVWGVKKSK